VAVATDAVRRPAGRRAPFAPAAWTRQLWQGLALAVLLSCALLQQALAHDVPAEFRAHVLVKADEDRIQMLVRLPLSLLLNIDLPKKGPGYIDLAQADEAVQRAAQAVESMLTLTANGRQLPSSASKARISLPSDRSFERFETARDAVQGPPLPADAYVFWNQGYFDVLLAYPFQPAGSAPSLHFNIAPGLKDRMKLDVRYIDAQGEVHAYDLPGAYELLVLDPRWYQAGWTFLQSGFQHILQGPDHLLFLLCLILPFRRVDWHLAGVITAFTVGHSVTLIAAAHQLAPSGAWFAPSVEFLIAASILYMAIENILAPNLARRWLYSGLFGLVHGFGFAFMLQSQLQFAGSHLLLSLLAFNVGIEVAQLLVLVAAMSVLGMLYRSRPGAERAITLVICLLVGHTAWHWMAERGDVMQKVDWSSLTGTAGVTQIVLILALLVAALAGARHVLIRLDGRRRRT
jgi:hypothetical protein